MTELEFQRRDLLFRAEMLVRKEEGKIGWDRLQRFLLVVAKSPVGKNLVIDHSDVVEYIQRRRADIARRKASGVQRAADEILGNRERAEAEAFVAHIEAMEG